MQDVGQQCAGRGRGLVQDQHGPVGVIGRGEDEKLGPVRAGIVAGVFKVAALKWLDIVTSSFVLLRW